MTREVFDPVSGIYDPDVESRACRRSTGDHRCANRAGNTRTQLNSGVRNDQRRSVDLAARLGSSTVRDFSGLIGLRSLDALLMSAAPVDQVAD